MSATRDKSQKIGWIKHTFMVVEGSNEPVADNVFTFNPANPQPKPEANEEQV